MLGRYAADKLGMAEPDATRDSRTSWCSNVWLRAGLLHPALFVAPLVGLCLVLAARSGSNIDDVGWGFWVIPMSAIASFITTVVMAARHPISTVDRVLIVLLGLNASGVALVLGFLGWLEAAEIACHGAYECPL
jgi:hypothetical protein